MSKLLFEFSGVARDDLPNELPRIQSIQHAIDLVSDSQLPNLLAYYMNPWEHEELKRKVKELLSKGFIYKSFSPCSIPLLLRPKKGGCWCMCIDSHTTNKLTIKYMFLT